MIDINSSIPPLLEPVYQNIQGLLNLLQYMVGGIFGLYLILVLIRWYDSIKLKRTLKSITTQLESFDAALKRIERKLAKMK